MPVKESKAAPEERARTREGELRASEEANKEGRRSRVRNSGASTLVANVERHVSKSRGRLSSFVFV